MSLMSSEAQIASQPQPQHTDRGVEPAGDVVQRSAQQGQARELNGFLHGGSEAVALDTGMRGQAEQSLGVDLGGVRVHQGAESDAANRDFGSRAFAHGSDVVLGSGVANDVNPVMAHELAHVAQQQGAAPGVAMKSERGESGSAFEVDADQAAARIMIGAPAKVTQTGAEMVMCFEGAEHMELGNAAWNGQQVTVGAVTLPAGAFTALQGDFFGTFAEMETACTSNPKMVYDYYAVLVKEGKLRDAHERDPANNAEPDSNGPIMVASLLNGRNPMEYLDLAATNFNHFSEQNKESDKLFKTTARANPEYAAEIGVAQGKFGHNIAQWLQMHLEAGKRAFEDGMAGKELGGVGVAMDAAAAHYLTDAFASGHMRVPRMEMYDEYKATFKAAARREIDKLVNPIPNEIDVKQFITNAGTAVVGAGRSLLPDWANGAIDGAADLVGQGADMAGVSMPSLPAMKIDLTGMKAAIKTKLHPIADSIGDTLGEKIAGFSAKVLHDYDNKNGVQVHNDAGQTWEAKGDHDLAGSKENEKVAIACTSASAQHVRDLHGAGKGHAKDPDKNGVVMPFKSLKPITSLLPQIDEKTKTEHTEPGGDRDWHWSTMAPAYRAQIKQNAITSVKDTVSSAVQGLTDKVKEVVMAKVRELVAGLGALARYVESAIDRIVDKIMSYIPTIDPTILLMAILV